MVQIAVIGAGLMGVKIAGEFAYHGHRVKLYDVSAEALNRVHLILEEDRKSLCSDGLLPQQHFLGQVLCLSRLEETVRDADFIFEVAAENMEVKQEIFESHVEVSRTCKPSAVIASNSLRLDINSINERALNKQRTLGLRFLFPVYYIPEIEVFPARETDIAVIEQVRALVQRMGKTLFFRSGVEPLVLTEQQREDRKAARQEEVKSSSQVGSCIQRVIPALHHSGNQSVFNWHKEAAMLIPSEFDRDCAICMDRLRDCLFTPCHHIVTCFECGQILQERHDACPVCRKDIEKTLKVYHT